MKQCLELYKKLVVEQQAGLDHYKQYDSFTNEDYINGNYRNWRSVQGEIENRIRDLQNKIFKMEPKFPEEPKLLMDIFKECVDAYSNSAGASAHELTDAEDALDANMRCTKADINLINFLENNVSVVREKVVIKEYNTEDETQEFVLFLSPEETITVMDALANHADLAHLETKSDYIFSEGCADPFETYQEVSRQYFEQGGGTPVDHEEIDDDEDTEEHDAEDDEWDDPTIKEYSEL